MRAAASYFRKELNKRARKILNVRFEDSSRSDLIQLADIVAGSINRSLHGSKSDANDYIALFKDKIANLEKIELKKRN